MIIAIDLDEVLSEFARHFIEFHNKKYGTNIKFSDLTAYRYWEIIDVTQKEMFRRYREFLEDGFFKDAPLCKDAASFIKSLKGHELHIVTGRSEEDVEATFVWLNKNFPGVFKSVNFSDTFHYGGKLTKVAICERIGADLIIEDSLEQTKEFHDHHIKVILIDMPWNRGKKLPSNFIRVKTLKEALKAIKEIEAKEG